MRGLGRYYELDVTCLGEADPVTGYFMNIKRIDEVVRDAALPIIADAAADAEKALELGALMQRLAATINPPLDDAVQTITLRLTPTHTIALETNMLDHVLISQQYEFSAAHRLHAGALSDDQNRRIFGKCNNPAGHGHNYRVEVTAQCPITPGGQTLAVEDLDAVVDEAVIEKLDHKHLNVDVPEFADRNPSVEHIAQVVFEMLDEPVRRRGAILDQVRVWETSKTVCTFRRHAKSSG
jgi:6-pyruvoyltetrahydropterin/6-carboxytetrahydropterin synthase